MSVRAISQAKKEPMNSAMACLVIASVKVLVIAFTIPLILRALLMQRIGIRASLAIGTVTFAAGMWCWATRLTPGTHVFSYLARAATPGEFRALPAETYGMYEPEVAARSTDARVAVSAGEAPAREPTPDEIFAQALDLLAKKKVAEARALLAKLFAMKLREPVRDNPEYHPKDHRPQPEPDQVHLVGLVLIRRRLIGLFVHGVALSCSENSKLGVFRM